MPTIATSAATPSARVGSTMRGAIQMPMRRASVKGMKAVVMDNSIIIHH